MIEFSIIIPVYNEEKRILKTLNKILEYGLTKKIDFEIIVAEDGSTDNTVSIIKDFQQKNDQIKLISFKKRMGKGGAITNAIFTATKKFVGFMDADMSAEPSEFDRLFKEISNYDIVIGSRLLRGNLPQITRPFYRSLFSLLYSKFFRTLFRIPIYDPQCGFKLFRREIVPKLFSELKTTQFAFDTELVVKAYNLGLTVMEVPIIWNHDAASKISVLRQIKEMGRDMLSIWYEAHELWRQNKKVYPQKKGTMAARILFRILSIYMKSQQKS